MAAVRDMGGGGSGGGGASLLRRGAGAPHGKNMACAGISGRMDAHVSPTEVPAPAKINLFLAITGRRQDGFHELLSVAAPLVWGDTLSVEPGGSSFSVECDNPDIPT